MPSFTFLYYLVRNYIHILKLLSIMQTPKDKKQYRRRTVRTASSLVRRWRAYVNTPGRRWLAGGYIWNATPLDANVNNISGETNLVEHTGVVLLPLGEKKIYIFKFKFWITSFHTQGRASTQIRKLKYLLTCFNELI